MSCRNLRRIWEREIAKDPAEWDNLRSQFTLPFIFSYSPNPLMQVWWIVRLEAELFQILKDDAVKVLHSICQHIWKTQQWPQDWKRPLLIPIPKKGNVKECWNYCMIVLISHASNVMLKILQARLQQYMDHELPDVQAGFRKGRGARDQIANIHWIIKKARPFQKKYLFLLYWLCQSLRLCGSQYTVENSDRDRNTRPPDLPLKKSVCRSGSNS